jgi:hypothetical protein
LSAIVLGVVLAATLVAVSAPAALSASDTAAAKTPAVYKNCEALNKRYPHGLGKAGARDRVKGRGEPVTTFRRNTKLFNTAMSYNRRLDGDKDGVACEQD